MVESGAINLTISVTVLSVALLYLRRHYVDIAVLILAIMLACLHSQMARALLELISGPCMSDVHFFLGRLEGRSH